jgi:hypothetical protein
MCPVQTVTHVSGRSRVVHSSFQLDSKDFNAHYATAMTSRPFVLQPLAGTEDAVNIGSSQDSHQSSPLITLSGTRYLYPRGAAATMGIRCV